MNNKLEEIIDCEIASKAMFRNLDQELLSFKELDEIPKILDQIYPLERLYKQICLFRY